MDNNVDNTPTIGYNEPNDANEVVIKMDEQVPINDPECQHELVADPEDTLGDAVYHGCIKPKCGVGFYIK